jgi:DNA-binding NtrC family response regulator
MMNPTGRILVVDDEPSVLVTYKMILQQQGHDVQVALTSREALHLVRENEFDLLLCDLSLEEKHTGFEVIDAARAQWPAVVCVILTGYASPEVAEQARRDGIAVLFKPIDIPEFLSTVNDSLRKAHGQVKASGG